MDWISTVEQAFDESIQELGVDMDEACDNGTYPKARDNVIDAVASIFNDDYDPRLDEAEERPYFRVYNAYVNLQFIANYMHTRMVERGDKLDKAEAKNAKLRELVQDMWDWLAPYADASGAVVVLTNLHERMCELLEGGDNDTR